MKFFSKNYFEDTGVLTVSTGDATKANMYDRNTTSQWASVGSNDTIVESVLMVWSAFKTFDYICLRNINLAGYAIYYMDPGTGAWTDFVPAINVAGNTDASVIHNFTAITTREVLLLSLNTFPANDEKRIGEFMTYLEKMDLPDEWLPETHKPIMYTKKTEHEKTTGGNLIIIENMLPKYQNEWEFSILKESLVNDFYDMYLEHQTNWVLPDEDELINQYFVNWTNDFDFKKNTAWDPVTGERGYEGSITVKEV